MKHLLLLFYWSFFALNAQQDVSLIVSNLPYNLSLGNGCGEFGSEGYKVCITEALELNGNVLEIMWVELTVSQNITNFGEEMDPLELLASGQLMLKCAASEAYQNESTIIVLNETLSTPGNVAGRLKIYPNPASGFVNIAGNNLQSVKCYDASGRLVFSIRNPSTLNKVYLFNYADGLYHLVLKDILGGIENRKLIIKG